jgi:hypothetical protein
MVVSALNYELQPCRFVKLYGILGSGTMRCEGAKFPFDLLIVNQYRGLCMRVTRPITGTRLVGILFGEKIILLIPEF